MILKVLLCDLNLFSSSCTLMHPTQCLAIPVNNHEVVADDSKHPDLFKNRNTSPCKFDFNSTLPKTLVKLLYFKGYYNVKENVTTLFSYVSVFIKTKAPRAREVIQWVKY